MGFNSHHHDEDVTDVSVHIHANGKKHVHHNPVIKNHSEAGNDHHKTKEDKDNCCNDKVMQFNELDKSVPNSLIVIRPILSITFVSTFNNVEILFTSQVTPNTKYFVRSYHPPITDIRVAIRSFQI